MRVGRGRVLLPALIVTLALPLGSGEALATGGVLDLIHDILHHHHGGGNGEEPPCGMYVVQDTGLNESRIVRFSLRDPDTGEEFFDERELSQCPTCDVEATALDPGAGTLYGFAGGSATSGPPLPEAGDLFEINRVDGSFTVIGSTGAVSEDSEIVGASFRPTDRTLWAFQQSVGLLTVSVADASTVVEFDVNGVDDQFGNPVGTNWEGLAWDLDGQYLYGTDGIVLYRWDSGTQLVDAVCSNLGPAAAQVEALEFSTDGRLIGSRHNDVDRTLIEIGIPVNDADFGPDACLVTEFELPNGPLLDDLESISFESCDLVPSACDLGRPQALVFEYTGESCNATTNNQGGKFFCWGNPAGAEPIRAYPLWLGGAVAIPSGQTIRVGQQFTIRATGSRLKNRTTFWIKKGLWKKQKLSIDTSCNRRINVGDQFGSAILREYVPED